MLFNLASYCLVVLTSPSSISVAVPTVPGWPIPIHIAVEIKTFCQKPASWSLYHSVGTDREKDDDDNADTFKSAHYVGLKRFDLAHGVDMPQ